MHSPAAKDPDLTSGLRGFNPGRARFQGNCVCLFLLACCLLLFVFVGFLFPSRAGRQSREAEPRSLLCVVFPLRFRYVSVTFPLRFRYISVAFPLRFRGAHPRGLCLGASVKEASVREQ